ncbi:hypothetical protein [Aeromonas jandaei]|uniref:hypothetical protein n=1 Tax=Aeromonas jandaei TaxID=650 RepID=UPI001ABFE6D0|nr:hypothetical protein [Aeromonas jandaei]QSR75025.1 hypothetical protein GP488_21255 [Aeromonas jandaei]
MKKVTSLLALAVVSHFSYAETNSVSSALNEGSYFYYYTGISSLACKDIFFKQNAHSDWYKIFFDIQDAGYRYIPIADGAVFVCDEQAAPDLGTAMRILTVNGGIDKETQVDHESGAPMDVLCDENSKCKVREYTPIPGSAYNSWPFGGIHDSANDNRKVTAHAYNGQGRIVGEFTAYTHTYTEDGMQLPVETTHGYKTVLASELLRDAKAPVNNR